MAVSASCWRASASWLPRVCLVAAGRPCTLMHVRASAVASMARGNRGRTCRRHHRLACMPGMIEGPIPLLSTFQWALLLAVVATCEDSLMTQRLTLHRIGRVTKERTGQLSHKILENGTLRGAMVRGYVARGFIQGKRGRMPRSGGGRIAAEKRVDIRRRRQIPGHTGWQSVESVWVYSQASSHGGRGPTPISYRLSVS
jgi:hypothetical protein